MKAYMQYDDGQVFCTDAPHVFTGATRLPAAKGKALLEKQTIARLKKLLKPGTTVYCILRHVSTSGMYRRISLAVKTRDGIKILDHDALALGLGNRPKGDADGVGVGGCGMDMGFHLVYNLGARLWPKGTPKPHGRRNGEPDSAGGYALKHVWL